MEHTYNKLVQAVELDKIFMHSSSSERFPISEINGDVQTEINVTQRLEFNVKDKFVSSVHFHVSAFEELNEENILFKIESVFILQYSIHNLDEKLLNSEELQNAINEFVNINVPVNAWPYGREFISQMTTRMGLPPLVIGTYKYFPKKQSELEE